MDPAPADRQPAAALINAAESLTYGCFVFCSAQRLEMVMGRCIRHPTRETEFKCMKHDCYLCHECLECRDPKIYCKFRTACPIWFMGKTSEKWGEDERLDLQNDEKRV